MTDQQNENLRSERLSLLIGTMIGQISELLNSIKTGMYYKSIEPSRCDIYQSLFDIHQAAGLQIHELYYKGNKP